MCVDIVAKRRTTLYFQNVNWHCITDKQIQTKNECLLALIVDDEGTIVST